MGTAVTVGMMAVSAYGQHKQASEQKKAGKEQARAQELANQIEQRRADIANQRERRLAAMQATATIATNEAAAAGYGASSMATGASSAIASGFAGAVGASNLALSANMARAGAMQSGYNAALRHQNSANNWGAVSGFAGGVASLSGWGHSNTPADTTTQAQSQPRSTYNNASVGLYSGQMYS